MDLLRGNLMGMIADVEGSKQAVKRVAESGATEVLCQYQVGGLDHERVVRSMELFASDVAQL